MRKHKTIKLSDLFVINTTIKNKKDSFLVYWLKYLTINNFKDFPFDSLFWTIRRVMRKINPFNYWTKIRRSEEGQCRECGIVLDNNKHWKRIVTFKKRDD